MTATLLPKLRDLNAAAADEIIKQCQQATLDLAKIHADKYKWVMREVKLTGLSAFFSLLLMLLHAIGVAEDAHPNAPKPNETAMTFTNVFAPANMVNIYTATNPPVVTTNPAAMLGTNGSN